MLLVLFSLGFQTIHNIRETIPTNRDFKSLHIFTVEFVRDTIVQHGVDARLSPVGTLNTSHCI
jgi:hypothetical protein